MKVIWDDSGSRIFETGVDRGVFYPIDGIGVPWNGLISVKENESSPGFENNYADGVRYRSDTSSGSFSATIDAITYPTGSLDNEISNLFNFCYRTKIGNDIQDLDYGYKIHLVYNALATHVERDFTSLSPNSLLVPFSWNLTTTPLPIFRGKATAHLIIDTTKAYPDSIIDLENFLYGTGISDPKFPSILELFDIFENTAILKITDHGDGTWTAEGPDDVVYLTDIDAFEINWPSAVYIDTNTYTVQSL